MQRQDIKLFGQAYAFLIAVLVGIPLALAAVFMLLLAAVHAR